MQNWTGKKVTVVGFSIEGSDLARYFANHGAQVTVSALRVPEPQRAAMAELEARGVRFRVGSNEASHVDGADLLAVTQGAPLTIAPVVAARERGIPVTSMTKLFLDNYPGPTVGITGSSGKTTTTSLVDAIFTAAARDHVLGGNIGLGLMQLLDEAQADPSTELTANPSTRLRASGWAVLEISHTQLLLTDRSPKVAALLRVTPNHLDQFSWDEYVALKKKIFEFQTGGDIAVFNADDPVTNELRRDARGRQFLFSVVTDPDTDGAFLKDGTIYWRRDGVTAAALRATDVPLRGFHNVANVTGATAIAAACGIGPEAVAAAVRGFKAPSHRLELAGRSRGVAYYNDSIATAPERTVAALRAFEEPIVLLLGGRDKKLPLEEMVALIHERCRAVVCFGESGPVLADAVEPTGVTVERVQTLAQAVEAASRLAQAGDVVLLSPACTSFDAYDNFEQRGADFTRLVGLLP